MTSLVSLDTCLSADAVSGTVSHTVTQGLILSPPGFLWPTWDSRSIRNAAGKRFVLVLLPPYQPVYYHWEIQPDTLPD